MTSNFEDRNPLRGKRVIRLVRCSTKGQADTSIVDQNHLCAAFEERNEMIYVDTMTLEGVSVSMPKTFIDQIIARKRTRNDFDVLLVQDTSRLTRSGMNHGAHLEWLLRAAGIEIIFVLDAVPEGDFGELMRGMQYVSGRQTAKGISSSATRGAQSALEDGRTSYCRRPPYGIDRLYTGADGVERYIIQNNADGSQVKLDPTTREVLDRFAKIVNAYSHNRKQKEERVILIPGAAEQIETVRRIFARRYADGWGLCRIARELNDLDVVGPTGKRWSMDSVKNTFMNAIYTGRSIGNLWTNGIYNMRSPNEPKATKLTAKQLSSRKRPARRIRPREDWIIRDEPRLVDYLEPRIRALAIAAQDKWLESKSGGYEPKVNRDRHRESPYMLKNILTSKQGGHAMTGKSLGRTGKRHRYYGINRSKRSPRTADKVLAKCVRAEPVEQIVMNVVRMTLLSAPMLKGQLKREIETVMKQHGGSAERMAKLQTQVDDLKRRQAFVIRNVTHLGEDEAAKQLADLARQKDDAQRALALESLSGAMPLEDADAVAERLIGMLHSVGKTMSLCCQPALRSLLQTLVAKAEVDLETGHLDLELRLPKSALVARDAASLVVEFSSSPTDQAHQESLLLQRFRAIRLPTMYIVYSRAA